MFSQHQTRSPFPQVELECTGQFTDRAHELLRAGLTNTVITPLAQDTARDFLRNVSRIYTDFDGTILEPGATVLSDRTRQAILEIDRKGVQIIGVTGKPFAEIDALLKGLPEGFPLAIIYEKGAFELTRDQFGGYRQVNLLATTEAVQATRAVKDAYHTDWKGLVEQKLCEAGTPVQLELAGTGTHECVFSIDVLDPEKLSGVADFRQVPGGRDAVKVHDRAVVNQVEGLLGALIAKVPGFEDSYAVNLGNSNIEWSPNNTECRIDKDLGVAKHAGFKVSQDPQTFKVTIDTGTTTEIFGVMGDSGNDKPLFSLAKDCHTMRALLTFHERTPHELLDHSDFLVAGCAGADRFLELIAAHR